MCVCMYGFPASFPLSTCSTLQYNTVFQLSLPAPWRSVRVRPQQWPSSCPAAAICVLTSDGRRFTAGDVTRGQILSQIAQVLPAHVSLETTCYPLLSDFSSYSFYSTYFTVYLTYVTPSITPHPHTQRVIQSSEMTKVLVLGHFRTDLSLIICCIQMRMSYHFI